MENSTTPQDSAAMPPASHGSVAEAWLVSRNGYTSVTMSDSLALHRQQNGCEIIPLYRSPTLTDAERTAIEAVIEDYEQDGEPASAGRVATLRGLLERL